MFRQWHEMWVKQAQAQLLIQAMFPRRVRELALLLDVTRWGLLFLGLSAVVAPGWPVLVLWLLVLAATVYGHTAREYMIDRLESPDDDTD